MAYLTKGDVVVIPQFGGEAIQALVSEMEFRRYRATDKRTGKEKWKAMPFAVCTCFAGGPTVNGTEFVIPGYKLKTQKKDGDRLLVLRDEYAAEFGGPWVIKMIAESKKRKTKKENK